MQTKIPYSAHAIVPKNISKFIIDKALQHNQSQTGGLAQIFHVKVNARVMFTKIYVKFEFDDDLAGIIKINTHHFSRQNSWVPIETVESYYCYHSQQIVKCLLKQLKATIAIIVNK